jgi:hypothetical protein
MKNGGGNIVSGSLTVGFSEALAAATQQAVCGWLANGGNQALTQALVAGALLPGGQVPALAGGLGLLALNYGCNYDPSKVSDASYTGSICLDGTNPTYIYTSATVFNAYWGVVVTSIGPEVGPDGVRRQYLNFNRTTAAGLPNTPVRLDAPLSWVWKFEPGSKCTKTGPITGTSTTANPPATYTDPVTNCVYRVEHMAWDVQDDGVVAPVVKISAGTPSAFASGAIVGGCNFSPVVYRPYGGPGGGGGGGGGGLWFPWAPGPDVDGEPWWVPLLRGAAGGAAGAAVRKLLDEIFKAKVAGRTYRVVSVCETDAQGEAVSQSREVQIPELPLLEGAIYRMDALEYLMQGLKDFKQPVCPTTRPRPQGELVTARFRSVDPSPASARKLRKELRYRDNAGRPEADHIAHWLPFEWSAGPAIVTSKGAAWGIVEVWAADPAEGRRVIEHAAAIAGVDLTGSGHAWVDSAPRSIRYGQTGRMRVEHTDDGVPCISKRVGPSGTPSWERDP